MVRSLCKLWVFARFGPALAGLLLGFASAASVKAQLQHPSLRPGLTTQALQALLPQPQAVPTTGQLPVQDALGNLPFAGVLTLNAGRLVAFEFTAVADTVSLPEFTRLQQALNYLADYNTQRLGPATELYLLSDSEAEPLLTQPATQPVPLLRWAWRLPHREGHQLEVLLRPQAGKNQLVLQYRAGTGLLR